MNHIPTGSGTSGSICEELELQTPVPVSSLDMFGVCLLSVTPGNAILPVVSGTVSRVPTCDDQLVDSVSLFSYSIFNDYILHLSANVTVGM